MQMTPATEFQFDIETGEAALVGVIAVRVVAIGGGTAIPASEEDIVENPAASGVYVATRISPAARGDYIIQWSLDGSFSDESIFTDDLAVRSNAFPIGDDPEPSGIDLCTLDDVIRYLPGYRANDVTDQKLQELITSESDAIAQESGREIVPFADQPETRAFTIDERALRAGIVAVGDLASAGDTDITVELLAADDTAVATYERSQYRALYRGRRRSPTHPWEPVRHLEFPRRLGCRSFTTGQTLLVTGNFGFPAIPYSIRQACAKRVVLRYITEVANRGDTFSEASFENVNLAGLFASARDAVDALKDMVMIR